MGKVPLELPASSQENPPCLLLYKDPLLSHEAAALPHETAEQFVPQYVVLFFKNPQSSLFSGFTVLTCRNKVLGTKSNNVL